MENRGYRSLFWPVILIGTGVVWLMSNLGWLPANSLEILLNLWPLLLIAIGLDLIFARRLPFVGILIGLFLTAIVVLVLFFSPNLNLSHVAAIEQRTLTVPLEKNESAKINLDLSSFSTTLNSLPESSTELFHADVYYRGDLKFSARGENDKSVIELGHSGLKGIVWSPSLLSADQRWTIGLSPRLPVDVTVNVASGSADLDFSELQLASLVVDGGSGSTQIQLPQSAQSYSVDYNGGSGSTRISLPEKTNLRLRLDGGSGSMNLDVPDQAAVRLEVRNGGSGSIHVPAGMTRIEGENGKDEGVWETSGYDQAVDKIQIEMTDLGSGSFTLR